MALDGPETSDWKTLRSVYNSAFFCSLGFFVVGFLIPIITYGPMNASATQVALVFSLLTLGTAAFSPAAGRFAKRGRRREAIFLGAIIRAIAYGGMALSILLLDVNVLILNSLIWGLGAAFYRVGMDAEISERVLRENRAEAFGRREAATNRGNVIGAFVGFTVLFLFEDAVYVFLLYALTNLVGGYVVLRHRPLLEGLRTQPSGIAAESVIGLGIAALVVATAIDTFISALLSPFVELYILDQFTTDIMLVALVYLPGGIIAGTFGGSMGRFADHQSKVSIVSVAVIIGAASTLGLVFIPAILPEPYNLLVIALLFSIGMITGIMAYTVMSSVFGTAYEGRAGEGFGMFEAAMGFARFTAPLVGGLLWDYINPSAPFILVGLSGFILVPIYVYGMKKYERALQQRDS